MIYRICFWNDTKEHEALFEVWDRQRVHLTRDDHRAIIARLFEESAVEGIYAEHISATVGVYPEGHPEAFRALTISYEMHSRQEFARVWANLYVNGEFTRAMTIGD